MINLNALNAVKYINNIKKEQPNNTFNRSMFVQKPDTFERVCNTNFTGKSGRLKEYNKMVNSLALTHENAQAALNGQLAMEGWAGKVADSVSVLWNSKNRATLVQSDLDVYKQQVDELKDSIKENKFTQKFKDIFGVEYNNKALEQYNKKAVDFKKALVASCMADMTSSKLKESLETYDNSNAKLQNRIIRKSVPMASTGAIPYVVEQVSADDVFNKMENDLVDVIGSKELLDGVLTSRGFDTKNTTKEEKYVAYGLIASYLTETANLTAKKMTKGMSLEELKDDYENAYHKAYGTKNNITERVDKYNRSQEIGAAAVRGAVRSGLYALMMIPAPASGVAKLVASSAATFAAKVVVDGTDKASSDVNNSFDTKAVKKLLKSSAISASEKLVSGGLSSIIPSLDTANEALNWTFDQVKGTAIDVTTGMTSERLKQGKWLTNQIVPRMIISTVFRNLGSDSEFAQELIKATKSGLNQTMKKCTRDYDSVQQFVAGTKAVLDKNYLEDKKTYAELKHLADTNYEQYSELMVELLEKELEEQDKAKSKK